MARRPCVLLWGQSNMEGNGLATDLIGTTYEQVGGDYPNVRILDPYAGYSSGPPATSTPAFVTLNLTNGGIIFNNLSVKDRSVSANIGPEISLAWMLRQHFGEELFIIKWSAGGTWMTPTDKTAGALTYSPKRIFDNDTMSTWSPAESGKMFDAWKALVSDGQGWTPPAAHPNPGYTLNAGGISALTTLYPGDQLDVRGVFSMIGENDSLDPYRAAMVYESMKSIRDKMRAFLVQKDMTTLSAEQIPWIMGRVRTRLIEANAAYTGIAQVNSAFDQLADDDEFCASVNTDDLDMNVDGVHYSGTGQLELGRRMFEAWHDTENNAYRQMFFGNATVQEIVDLAKERYALNSRDQDHDLTTDQIVTLMEEAQRDLLSKMGANAYFLRRRQTFPAITDGRREVQFPWWVDRIISMERDVYSRDPVDFEEVGLSDRGAHIYRIPTRDTNVVVEFMPRVYKLANLTDRVAFPPDHQELLLTSLVRRMARYGGGDALAAQMRNQENELLSVTQMRAQKHDANRRRGVYGGFRNVIRRR